MIFNSIEFAIFLPIVFLLYWLVFNKNLRLQNLFIVAVSYLFYGWWDWRFLFLIAFTSLCSWASGLLIEQYRQRGNAAKWISAANIVLNLVILGIFKYYDFFAQSFANLFLGGKADGILLHLILPVGISFYTFQALSYSIDVYRGQLKPTHDAVEFFAYVSFFPQLVAGPIERASNLLPQFQQPRTFQYETTADGMRQILWGLFKKVVIADNCGKFVDPVFQNAAGSTGSELMVAALLFTFQIYGDFSGYSDIAIGTAKLFGIKLMRNFKFPYFSRDIAEFWRRWHVSLTTWFRDYLYIPLGGSRCKKAKVIRNTFIIFLVSGLWHGANWTFLAWGAYHALLFLPLILAGKNRKYRSTLAPGKWFPGWKALGQMAGTFFLVVLGWVIFRADSLGQAGTIFKGMCQLNTLEALYRFFMLPERMVAWLIVAMMLVEWAQRDQEHGLQMPQGTAWYIRYPAYLAVIICIVLYCGSNQAFIYFQF